MELKKVFTTFALAFTIISALAQQKDYNIISYGAKSDGITNNVYAIQKAIDDASSSGGGRVIVPRGRFLSGVIHLKSNVTLYVHDEGVLLASFNRDDYGPSQNASAFIVANNAKNISIQGKGMIDGQCDLLIHDIYQKLIAGELHDNEWKVFNPWHQRRPGESNRPKLIDLENCTGVIIKNIHLQNATDWVEDYKNCENVIIDSIDVFSNTYWNNDGIDITDCKNVKITNCNINCADDGICLKSEDRDRRCENIYVADCRVRSSASAVKFGTASKGGFKNIVIKNIDVYNTFRSAIAIETVDGGALENVYVNHIRAVNTGNAIFIRLGHRNKDSVYSTLRKVYISDIKADVPKGKPDKGYPMEGPELKYPSDFQFDTIVHYKSASPWNNSGVDSSAVPYPHNIFPSSITGIPGHPVEDVTLDNIEITYEGGGSKKINYFPLDSFNVITEAIHDYPEFSMFGEIPVWGLYVRHVKNLTLKNIKLINKKEDYRTSVLINDVQKISLEDFIVSGATACPILFFNKANQLALSKTQMPSGCKVSIRINK